MTEIPYITIKTLVYISWITPLFHGLKIGWQKQNDEWLTRRPHSCARQIDDDYKESHAAMWLHGCLNWLNKNTRFHVYIFAAFRTSPILKPLSGAAHTGLATQAAVMVWWIVARDQFCARFTSKGCTPATAEALKHWSVEIGTSVDSLVRFLTYLTYSSSRQNDSEMTQTVWMNTTRSSLRS